MRTFISFASTQASVDPALISNIKGCVAAECSQCVIIPERYHVQWISNNLHIAFLRSSKDILGPQAQRASHGLRTLLTVEGTHSVLILLSLDTTSTSSLEQHWY